MQQCGFVQYVSEAVAALAEANFKVKDISAAVQVYAIIRQLFICLEHCEQVHVCDPAEPSILISS